MPNLIIIETTLTETLWNRTLGTNIGDMTSAGGLAASFDGNTSQSNGQCSVKSNAGTTGGFVGKDIGTAAPASKVIATTTNNIGFTNSGSVTLTLYGSNSSPANPSDGTSLGTNAIGSAGSNSTNYTVTSSDTSTAYRYIWVRVASNTGGSDAYCAELAIYTMQ